MAQSTPAVSLIAALHARYEATQAEYDAVDRVDTAQGKERDDNSDVQHYRTALLTSERESDALRNAILYQVPDTWSDALILQFHIVCAYDMYSCATEPNERDNERLQVAIDTLFDFMCGEATVGTDEIGPGFTYGASRARRLRRLRTGVVEA